MSIPWHPGLTLAEGERLMITAALAFYRTKAEAAEALGVSPRTLRTRLALYANWDRAERLTRQRYERQLQNEAQVKTRAATIASERLAIREQLNRGMEAARERLKNRT